MAEQPATSGKHGTYIYAAISMLGDRDENQDAWMISPCGKALKAAVADGLGGHEGGSILAQALCRLLQESADFPPQPDKQTLETWLVKQQALLAQSFSDNAEVADAHTTLTFAYCAADLTAIAHIGDSRIYHFGADGSVLSRTRDHSVAHMLLDEGEITEEELATHPDQSKLYKAISLKKTVGPRIKIEGTLEPGQSLLLCSDGFWTGLTKAQLSELVTAPNLSDALTQAAKTAVQQQQGDSDNVTAVVIKCL